MSDDAIFNAFAERATAFAAQFSPTMPVAYPGIGFAPPTSGVWLELKWFPNETLNYGMENDAPSLKQGFGQVSVCYRPGGGIMSGLALVEQVIVYFGKGTIFDGVRVYRKPWASSVLEEPERISHPVTVMWRGFDA